MGGFIPCICGYRGPSVSEAGREVCPICRTPAGMRAKRLHVPCPRGHVLSFDQATLGSRVVCPQCNEFFVPKAENSVEQRREDERLQREAEARSARLWVVRAVVAVAAVLLALAVTIIVAASRR